ncbi:MAG: hypothetical protein HYU02_08130 [Thaumarchaeota archaeon]|nr:hypothetical protein [Nitrososphaerota archaeon]MBI3022601.1 hypothetical protein [Nitrososphaerota archaeon]
MSNTENEHAFSIELRSRENLKSVRLGDNRHEQVFIEGFLGQLLELNLVERSMLEVKGVNGTLRLDIDEIELKKYVIGQGATASR